MWFPEDVSFVRRFVMQPTVGASRRKNVQAHLSGRPRLRVGRAYAVQQAASSGRGGMNH